MEEDGKETEEKATGVLGHELFWHIAGMICQATNECLVEHEPGHHGTARFIPGSSVLPSKVTGKNVKFGTRTSLQQKYRIGHYCHGTSMVDYAIVIKPSRDFSSDTSRCLHSRIIEKLRPEIGVASINQTASEWVRFKLIAVNIETKRGAVEEDKAHVQLGTWITAQFARLRQLTTSDTEFPSLPVLSVQGKRWLLMIASMKANERKRARRRR